MRYFTFELITALVTSSAFLELLGVFLFFIVFVGVTEWIESLKTLISTHL